MIKVQKYITVKSKELLEGEKLFEEQMNVRANYLLLGDDRLPNPPLNSANVKTTPIISTTLKWINRGEIIAGSWVSSEVFNSKFGAADVDIYFKSRNDVEDFLKLNRLVGKLSMNKIAATVDTPGFSLNLIFGVHYEDVGDLIYRFDFRACSTALDPNSSTIYWVDGAVDDALQRRIVYNPLPHNTSIARLVKYVNKGFTIDAHQRVFLLDLIKTGTVNPDVELTSGYRAVKKV